MKKTHLVAATLLCAISLAPAQQPIAPPPRPADNAPSLLATMQFLQDKLNALGSVSYAIFIHDTKDGSDSTKTHTIVASHATADPAKCHISYRQKFTIDGKAGNADDVELSFHDLQDVVVKPIELFINEGSANAGEPNIIVQSTNPPITVLLVRGPHGVLAFLPFADAQLADRVAKATTHAIELCGGGAKEPF